MDLSFERYLMSRGFCTARWWFVSCLPFWGSPPSGEEDAEAKTEAGAREAGAEVEPIGGAEVSHDI